MSLSQEEFDQLHTALMDAFPSQSSLSLMVRTGLGINLSVIVGTGRLLDIVYQLIEWAEAQGRDTELVTKAYEKNSGNPVLCAFVGRFPHLMERSNPPIAYAAVHALDASLDKGIPTENQASEGTQVEIEPNSKRPFISEEHDTTKQPDPGKNQVKTNHREIHSHIYIETGYFGDLNQFSSKKD